MFRARNEVPPRGASAVPQHAHTVGSHTPFAYNHDRADPWFICRRPTRRKPPTTLPRTPSTSVAARADPRGRKLPRLEFLQKCPDGFAQSTQRESVRDVWESRNANICAGLQVRIARTRVPPVRSVMARRVPSVSGLNAPVDMSFRTSVSHCDAMHAVSTANPDSPPGTGRTGRRATPTQTPTRRASPDSRTLARRTREKESLELSRTWTPVPRASHAFRLMSVRIPTTSIKTRRSVLRMADENASVLLDRAPWYVS
ncbi:hypothetical protein C8Q80DRAFT_1212022 [Daedaleopsis nitida]|nr:hypothetical protein C8Q80DRAFT_1212022 [Daedaleopsis nitida]